MRAAGHSAPTGHCGCARGRERSPLARPEWPVFSPPGGSGQRRPPPARAQQGREPQAPGRRGRPDGGAAPSRRRGPGLGGQAGLGQRPRAPVRPRSAGLDVGLSGGRPVCPRLGAAGPRGDPRGKRAPLTCSRRRRGRLSSETGAATRVFVADLLAARGGAVLLGGRSREPRKKPEPRPLSPPSPLPPSPIPERSPRSLAACEARGQRGRAAGRRRRGEGGERAGRKEGCRLRGWGRRGKGAAATAAPPCGQRGSRAPWPCALPAATPLRSAPSASPGGLRTPGVRTADSEQQRLWGTWRGGVEGQHLLRQGGHGRGTVS